MTANVETKGRHTPGPWEWLIHDHSMASLGTGDNPGLGDPLVLAIGPCPACAGRAEPKEWEWGRCHTPSEADARLIAAAPDLLAALTDIMTWYDKPEAPLSEMIGKSDEAIAMFDRARAAIAKTLTEDKV